MDAAAGVVSGGLSKYIATGDSEIDAVMKAEMMFSNWIVHQNLASVLLMSSREWCTRCFPIQK